MPEHDRREFRLLAALPVIGIALPITALAMLGGDAAWKSGLALLGAVGACYRLVTFAFSTPTPAMIAATLVSVSLGRAAWHAARQLVHTRRGVRPLVALARSTPRLERACRRVSADPTTAFEVTAPTPTSFCAGLLRRRIILTSALADSLTEAELAAVVAHEAHHLRGFDPARMLVARCATVACFWLPTARDLRRRHLTAQELAADQAAIRLLGRRPLGSALLKICAAGPSGTASFGNGALDVRVDALLGLPVRLPPVSRARLVLTAAAFIAEVGLVIWAASLSPVRDAPSFHAISPMLRSASIHGLIGMTTIAALNAAALAYGSRICGGIRSRLGRKTPRRGSHP